MRYGRSGRRARVGLGGTVLPLTHFQAVEPIQELADIVAFEDRAVLGADHAGLNGADPLRPAAQGDRRRHPSEVKPAHILDVLLEIGDDQAGMMVRDQGAADVTREQDTCSRIVEGEIA